MTISINPFSDLIPNNQQKQKNDIGIQNGKNKNPFIDLVPKQEMINTFLGTMPKNVKELQLGTPENKKTIENMIGMAAGGPGIKALGAGAAGFGKGVASLFNRVAPKQLAYGVQKAHDTMQKELSSAYDYIKDQAVKRGIGKINIPNELFEQAEKNLPNTKKYKDLINKARNGDYKSLHELQSDLGIKGTAAKGAKIHADRNIGEEMLDTRKQINKEIESHLRESGNNDLADQLSNASNRYAKYKKLYYSDKGIANLVHNEKRLVPKNPLNLFSKESKPMSRILEAHPEIKKALENEETARKFLKSLDKTKKVGVGIGIGGGALYGMNTLTNLLKHLGGQ